MQRVPLPKNELRASSRPCMIMEKAIEKFTKQTLPPPFEEITYTYGIVCRNWASLLRGTNPKKMS